MNVDGSDRKLLLQGRHWSPSWSPDGQWIVFTSGGIIRIINIAGDSIRTFHGINNLPLVCPDWSRDGKEILFSAPLTTEGGVFAMSPAFDNVRKILNPLVNNGMFAKWSPDRSKIVYSKGNQHLWESTEIFTIDTLLTTEVRLTSNSKDDRDPSWSPVGGYISWSSNVRICRMNEDGSNTKTFGYGQYPNFSPDGHYIVYSFANSDYTKEVVWRIDIDGKNKVQLTF